MRFGSVCSGIEAASVAWHPLGWRAAWLAEIEPFPSAVLAHHYPEVPNLGDMNLLPARIAAGEVEAPDVFCGGTPCQAFSVAGLRRSLDDARGNLSLIFCEIADAIDHARAARGEQPAIVFWENVPGVLSTKDNAFGCFLAGLAGEDDALVAPGGKWSDAGVVLGPQRAVAWRVLDAQYFGLAQRRRRVFVVASAREDFDPVEVLLVEQGVRRDSPPCREAREGVAASVIKGAAIGRKPEAGPQYGEHLDDGSCYTLNCVDQHAVVTGGLGVDTTHTLTFSGNRTGGPIDVSPALLAQPGSGWKGDFESEAFITTTHTLRGEGFDASEDGTGRGTPLVPVAFDTVATLDARAHAGGFPGTDGACGGHVVPVSYAIQAGALRTNPASGPDGVGVQADHAYTLEARAEVQAVAIRTAQTGSNGWGVNTEGTAYTLDSAQQAVAFHHNAQACQLPGPDTDTSASLTCSQQAAVAYQGNENACTYEADSGSLLRTLRQRLGAEAVAEWGSRILDSLQSPEVLRAWLHGQSIRCASGDFQSFVDDCPLPREEGVPARAMRFVWENGPDGRTSQGRGLAKQLAHQLGKALPELPHSLAPSAPGMQVRRLTPTECERLMGFPDSYTAIPWRGKAADQCPDGPRYKALGNSWAVPVVRWIGARINDQMLLA